MKLSSDLLVYAVVLVHTWPHHIQNTRSNSKENWKMLKQRGAPAGSDTPYTASRFGTDKDRAGHL